MADISGITGVSDASALAANGLSTAGGSDLGGDTFLTLLTTQMQHQDPLSPMANEEFLAQLAQFSSLEQLMGLNDTMQGAALGISSLNNASMANLVGKDVVAVGDTFAYDGEGEATLHYSSPVDTSAELTVFDEDGDVVWSGQVSLAAGEGEVTWAGLHTSGAQAEEGTYSFSLSAEDSDGQPVNIQELIAGTIDSMDYSSGTPIPSIDGVTVPLADLLRLTVAADADELAQ